jgi:spore coat polysaccharide biosynthesis protein SpsF
VIPGVLSLVAVRMKSSRLTEKAMLDLAGAPVIARLMERISGARAPEAAVVCTSTHPQDDALAALASSRGWAFHRGHELDVIGRFLDVARVRKAHTVIRITGDNPLTDPGMLDHMVTRHLADGIEYSHTDDLPRGTRCEVMQVSALERCYRLAQDPNASEYMTLMIRRPDHFRVLRIDSPWPELRRPELRLTIDTPQDYAVVRAIFEAFGGQPPSLANVIRWLDEHPDVKGLNASMGAHEPEIDMNVRLKGDMA